MPADRNHSIESLVEEGLALYSRGDLDAALVKWQAALAVDPENTRAREYLRYVEENRAALEESFQMARAQAAVEAAQVAGQAPAQAVGQAPDEPPAAARSAEKVIGRVERRLSPAEEDCTLGAAAQAFQRGEETAKRKNKLEPVPELSREVLEIEADPPPRRSPSPTSELELSDIEIAGAGPPPPPPTAATARPRAGDADGDPSFMSLAAEITRTAQRISEELPRPTLAQPSDQFDPEDDYTPRIDLGELKAKVAATKRRLTRELSPVTRDAPPPPEAAVIVPSPEAAPAEPAGSPADAPTAPVLLPLGTPLTSTETPTPGGGSPAVSSSRPTRGSVPALDADGPQPASGHRIRRSTPFTLIGGGGEKPAADFEPFEPTPVASKLPEPSRLVAVTSPPTGEGLEPLDEPVPPEELKRDTVTPARLSPDDPKVEPVPALGAGEPAELDDLCTADDDIRGNTYIGLGPRPLGPSLPASIAITEAEPAPPSSTATSKDAGADKLDNMLEGARQLHEQGTFEGSLWLCERALTMDPGSAEAKKLLALNQQILLKQYQQQIADPSAVPVVQIPQHEIMWHKLDHRAGFLLSRIDGQLSFEDLLDVSGMGEFEAYRILAQLLGQGVIGPR